LPRIQRPPRIGSFDWRLRRLHIRSRRRVLFYRRAEFVERAIVLRILRRNSRRNRLRAFKLRARIEEPALLAAVQFKIAFRTLSLHIKPGHQHRAAIRAPCPRYRPHHPRRARPQVIGGAARAALRWLAVVSIFLLVLFLFLGITIAAVSVLAIHKRLRPSFPADCHFLGLHNYSRVFTLLRTSNRIATIARADQPSP